MQQEDAEVVLVALAVGATLPAGSRAGVQSLGRQRQAELDVGLDLAGVERAAKGADLDGTSVRVSGNRVNSRLTPRGHRGLVNATVLKAWQPCPAARPCSGLERRRRICW